MSTTTTAPQPAAPTARPSARDPFLDNAKLLLVMLVVVGHAWVLMPDAPSSFPAYTFLYAWHVPAFVIVTGYLSRSFTYSRANLRRLATTVVAPYLVFETLIALFRITVGHESMGSPLYVDPHWPMWYLAVLFLWRLATPWLNRVRHPLVVAAVLALAALALVPRSRRWFTPLGAASLVVYLCHGFFVKAAEYAGAGNLVELDEVTAFVIITGAAVLLTLALAATPVARRLNKLVDPISTAVEDTPGILPPHHHREHTHRHLALPGRHPTRF